MDIGEQATKLVAVVKRYLVISYMSDGTIFPNICVGDANMLVSAAAALTYNASAKDQNIKVIHVTIESIDEKYQRWPVYDIEVK